MTNRKEGRKPLTITVDQKTIGLLDELSKLFEIEGVSRGRIVDLLVAEAAKKRIDTERSKAGVN